MKNKIILTVFLLVMQQVVVRSQDQPVSEHKLNMTSRINFSYHLGGQIYNDHFLYNPGFSMLFTQSLKLSNSFEAGIGSGYTSLTNESFIPFFIEAFGYRKNSYNSPFIRFQIGYSTAWYRNDSFPSDYSLQGGLYFSAGMGRKIQVGKRYSVLFQWAYCHQSVTVSYQIFGGQEYSSAANYDMIQLSFGVMRE